MVRLPIFLSLLGLAAASPLPPHKLVPASLQDNFTTNSNSTRNSTTVLSPLEMAMKANLALHYVARAPIISIDYNDPSTQAASERDMPKTVDLGKRDDDDEDDEDNEDDEDDEGNESDKRPGMHCYDGTLVMVPLNMWPGRGDRKGFQVMTYNSAIKVQEEIKMTMGPGWEPPALENFTGDTCVPL